MSRVHQPVLLEEAITALMVSTDGTYVDGTFGRGGHSARILETLSPRGSLLALDQDPEAAAVAQQLMQQDARFSFRSVNFRALADCVTPGSLQGRGFSFSHDGPLDMRMNPSAGQSAAAWLAAVKEAELAKILKEFGEERFARRIAAAIVAARDEVPIERTGQLAEIVAAANPKWEQHKHPATRSFQAIRLQVNGELDALRSVLSASVNALAPGGRLVVISFHSLEDRIVKRFIRDAARGQYVPPGVPIQHHAQQGALRLIGKAVMPSATETAQNPRARSAVMRVAERLS